MAIDRSKSMELLEVLNEDGFPTREVLDKDEIHDKGLYHREVALFLIDNKNELLLQKRASTKKIQPNKWAWHGGHVQAKESEIKAIIRETQEELGITLKEEQIKILTTTRRDKMPNRQFTTVFIAECNLELEDFTIETSELSQIKWFSIDEFEEMIFKNHPDMMFTNNSNTQNVLEALKKYLKYISFPTEEHASLNARLSQGKTIYSTRVSNEVGKYHLDEVYKSHFGTLKITSIKHITALKEHPFYFELTENQRAEIEKYIYLKGADVIALTKL